MIANAEKEWTLYMAKSIASTRIDYTTFIAGGRKQGKITILNMKRNFKSFMKEANLLKRG